MRSYIRRTYELVKPGVTKHNELYTKLCSKQPHEDWFVGVKTTGIACTLDCTARPPLQENVVFSKYLIDLISFGFRECKICKPLSNGAGLRLQPFLKKIQSANSPDKAFEKENKPAAAWIRERHRVDVSRYIRVKRVNYLLKNKNSQYTRTLYFRRYWTSQGMMLACFTHRGLCLLEFFDRLMLEAELTKLQKKFKANFKKTSKNEASIQLDVQLQEYFSGNRARFTVPLDKIGSEFQKSVWAILEEIPAGETRTYQQQAVELGKPKAARAVANANGANMISILIPCHRVVGVDGKLTGYGGGLPRKKFLLDLEKPLLKTAQKLCNKKRKRQATLFDFVNNNSLAEEEQRPKKKMHLTPGSSKHE